MMRFSTCVWRRLHGRGVPPRDTPWGFRCSSSKQGDGRIETPKQTENQSKSSDLIRKEAESSQVRLRPDGKQLLIPKRYHKPLEQSYETVRPIKDPFLRAFDNLKPFSMRETKFYRENMNHHYDVCVIGGGIVGCSIAYFLASRVYKGMEVCVVERDPTYRHSTSVISMGGLRQQFSLPENVQMSLFGADFIRQAKRLLYVEGVDMPDVRFQPHGHLFLASEENAEAMQEDHRIQLECGAKAELLTPIRLKRKFPWLNTEGVALASYGFENEGWFDPWALLAALKIKCMDLGVHFIDGEVYNIAHEINQEKVFTEEEINEDESSRLFNRAIEAHIYLPDGDVWPVNASIFVIAAGAESGHVAHLAGIGSGCGILRVPLPVEPRKRYTYRVSAPDGPGLNCPFTADPSGVFFRREGLGGHYLCGRNPQHRKEEPHIDDDYAVDEAYFDQYILPSLSRRVPTMSNAKIETAWSGYYDHNFWDGNPIIGTHPYHRNIYFATGVSAHGVQQAPAIGRAIMELIMEADFKSIDLIRLGFDRLLNDIRIQERGIAF